ncbi:glycosyltransferase family 2 protein [Oceanibacterium hippocampi]|uniref:Chondroitin synthase n=1 Tax=Oceanibacterium hippocampi TaxID=745714 RepID=A0A1Y5SU07_9PROT|nr:glycosyltransferase family 2 protein [Oceanibacterium hippocampi]SLN48508.1 Chondroitin synthase [Oceanibacterium hippocampi]
MTAGGPTVSFVVTVYNKARYLPRVLAALADQEGEFAREYVIVDDGSTDGSAALVREATRDWPNLILIEQANAGPAFATNAGLARATGDYVKLVDGDDVLRPDATLKLLDAIRRGGAGVAFGRHGRYDPDASATPSSGQSANPPETAPEIWPDPLPRVIRAVDWTPSDMLARRELLFAAGGCDERVFVQDYSLFLRLAGLGPFAQIDDLVADCPLAGDGGGDRMSNRAAQETHDLNAALGGYLADRADLAPALCRLAARRATGRARRFVRQNGQGSRLTLIGPWLRARLPLPLDRVAAQALIERSCAAIRAVGPVRLPGSQPTMSAPAKK